MEMDRDDVLPEEEEVFRVAPVQPVRVIAGANTIELDELSKGCTVADLRNRLCEILTIGPDHAIVLVNGSQVESPERYLVREGDEIEFKRPAGQKGADTP